MTMFQNMAPFFFTCKRVWLLLSTGIHKCKIVTEDILIIHFSNQSSVIDPYWAVANACKRPGIPPWVWVRQVILTYLSSASYLFTVIDRPGVAHQIEVNIKGTTVALTREALSSNGPTNDFWLVIMLQLPLWVIASPLRHYLCYC